MSGAGEASWADFAEAIFKLAEQRGRRPVTVRHIATADYPTAARRPANSRLDNRSSRAFSAFGCRRGASPFNPSCLRLLADA